VGTDNDRQVRCRNGLQGELPAPDGRGGAAASADHHHKRGKPIAKLVPVEKEAIDLFGRMAGSIKI
jgi:hypothetical protein